MGGGRTIRVEGDAAGWAARSIGRRLGVALRERGEAALAVSGGSTAPPMLAVLAHVDLAWERVGVWQVDERVAPDGDPDRNANHLPGFPGRHHLMPVTSDDLDRACARYADTLPERFDVVHLGMGPDGHTASWPPRDPVIDSDKPVALSGEYQGRVRMTITPGVVNAARGRVVLITGADKAPTVAAWLDGDDAALPIARIRRTNTVVILDAAAAGTG